MTYTHLRLRLLHLSDLHAQAGRSAEPWQRRRVLGPAWEANLEALLEDGPFDLVCFTGDAADRGTAEEYDEAGDFLLALMERLQVGRERLFVVPGNHDIDRGVQPEAWAGLRQAAWDLDDLELARWLAAGSAPRGAEPAWRERVIERQAAYRSWVRDGLGRGELDPAAGPHGLLGYRVTFERHGVPVHVIGLDTAWLCGDDHDAARLWVTDEQVMRLLTDERGAPLDGLRLVLQHHPLEELADGRRIRTLLAEHADLVLRGHLHESELSTWADPSQSLRQLAAGCLYKVNRGDHGSNTCQAVTLDLDGGRPQRVEVRSRRFSLRGGHWFDDDGLYRESGGGRLSWSVPRLRATAAEEPNPFEPWTPVAPPIFQGRESELHQLDAALGSRDCVSIVGGAHVGKSSLLLTWQQKLEASGRKVRYLDGQGPEGETETTFVGKAIGRHPPDGVDAAADALADWADAEPDGLAPVLLIDELDGLLARFDPGFLKRLRDLLGKIVLVVASRREVEALYRDLGHTSPFDKLRLLRLGLLDKAAALEVILSGDELEPDAADLMHRWAGRHPLYLQLLGHALVEAHRHGEDQSFALERFRDEAGRRLDELWRRLDEGDREALRATIKGQPNARKSLIRRALVDESGQPFGEVLAAWLRGLG